MVKKLAAIKNGGSRRFYHNVGNVYFKKAFVFWGFVLKLPRDVKTMSLFKFLYRLYRPKPIFLQGLNFIYVHRKLGTSDLIPRPPYTAVTKMLLTYLTIFV